jgi:hypothetical protein
MTAKWVGFRIHFTLVTIVYARANLRSDDSDTLSQMSTGRDRTVRLTERRFPILSFNVVYSAVHQVPLE